MPRSWKGRGLPQPGSLSAVDLASVSDARHDDDALRIVDGVDHAVVADSNSVVVARSKLHRASRPRIDAKGVDRLAQPVAEWPVQAAVLAYGRRVETDLVRRSRRARYSRTSAQGIALSRSSRACRAA